MRIKTQEGFDRSTEHAKVGEIVGMRDALLWLASNVSDEMVQAASAVWKNDQNSGSFEELLQFVIAAALRQAAGGEG